MLIQEREEVMQTIRSVQTQFEELAVRGLRAADSENIARLRSVQEEFVRIGAMHLAERSGDLVKAMENDDVTAASALLRAQTSLRLFERILTTEAAGDTLAAILDADENPNSEFQ